MNRKNQLRFHPQHTIDLLRSVYDTDPEEDEKRQKLVDEYLEVRISASAFSVVAVAFFFSKIAGRVLAMTNLCTFQVGLEITRVDLFMELSSHVFIAWHKPP